MTETYRAAHIIRDAVDRNTELEELSRSYQTDMTQGDHKGVFGLKGIQFSIKCVTELSCVDRQIKCFVSVKWKLI